MVLAAGVRLPPLPHPLSGIAAASERRQARTTRGALRGSRKIRGSRQRTALPGSPEREAVVTVVIVLIVATEVRVADPLMVRLDGSREQVAYWPRLTGVQLRATAPVYPFCGTRVRL